MKPYNVKSNAKRFARGIAAKYPGRVEVAEPVETEPGSREWYSAVSVIDGLDETCAEIAAAFPDAVYIYGYTDDPIKNGVAAAMSEGDAGVYTVPADDMAELGEPIDLMQKRSASLFGGIPMEAVDAASIPARPWATLAAGITLENLAKAMVGVAPPVPVGEVPADAEIHLTPATREAVEARADASGLKAMFDEVPPVGDVDGFSVSIDATPEDVARGELPVTVTICKPRSVGPSTANLMEMAAAIPPTPKRSREEIEAARAERRERVAKEKAEGLRTPSGDRVQPKKISKKKTILDLVKRKGGATQAELEAATGWQRHTLRGYIAGTLRKQLQPLGLEIECIRGKGEEPTRYRIPMMDAARAEGGVA